MLASSNKKGACSLTADDALVEALQALHAANVDGGVSMADLRSIAVAKCTEAVASSQG